MPNRSTELVQSLNTLLTPERLAPYRAAAGGGTDRALDLYEWNGRISAAVFEDLDYLEVVLRNACHHQLSTGTRPGADPTRGTSTRSSPPHRRSTSARHANGLPETVAPRCRGGSSRS